MSNIKNLDIREELKSVRYITLLVALMTIVTLVVAKIQSKELVRFFTFVELIFFMAIFRGYLGSIKKLNYGLWGFSFIILLITFRNIIHFSFVNFDIFLLYINLFSLTLFMINSYVMSSPLYYPRVRWWEYDYKYRADIKVFLKFDNEKYEGRLTDLRRSEASIEMFEHVNLEETGELVARDLLPVSFQIKNSKDIIHGRPIRYGLRFYKKDKAFLALKSFWSENKSVKLRNKFKK